MKFKTSALAMTATVAVGLMSSAFAAETSYEKLGFTTNQTYSVTVEGSTITTSPDSTLSPTPTAKEGVIEIDSDETEPLRFTPATANAVNDATELKFNVEASVVPNSVTLTNDTSAQCGFAIKETIEGNVASTNFCVFTGSEWTNITTATPAIPTAQFKLTVKLDYRTGFGKAQYLVDGVALGDGAWYSIKSGSQKVSCIDFIGNGKLASLRGDVLQVASEIIPIDPTGSGDVEVKFSEQQLNALRTALGSTDDVIEKLNSTKAQNNNQRPFDNYILYGKIKDEDITASTVPVVKANPAVAPEGHVNNVVVTVPTLNIQVVEGVTVTHKLMGSATGTDGSWTQVGDAKTGANPQFEIPYNSTYRYFKVETAVSTTNN